MNEDKSGTAFLVGILVGMFFAICIWMLFLKTKVEEQSIRTYIQNPDKFKVEYVTYKGDTTDIVVTYLK